MSGWNLWWEGSSKPHLESLYDLAAMPGGGREVVEFCNLATTTSGSHLVIILLEAHRHWDKLFEAHTQRVISYSFTQFLELYSGIVCRWKKWCVFSLFFERPRQTGLPSPFCLAISLTVALSVMLMLSRTLVPGFGLTIDVHEANFRIPPITLTWVKMKTQHWIGRCLIELRICTSRSSASEWPALSNFSL